MTDIGNKTLSIEPAFGKNNKMIIDFRGGETVDSEIFAIFAIL